MSTREISASAVARQLLLGLRESLTIASQLGSSAEAVNEALVRLRDRCGGCLALARPYADEPRIVVTVVDGGRSRAVLGAASRCTWRYTVGTEVQRILYAGAASDLIMKPVRGTRFKNPVARGGSGLL
jgi:hypothetical protein